MGASADLNMLRLLILIGLLSGGYGGGHDDLATLQKDLQQIVAARAAHWNCTFSVAAFGPSALGDAPMSLASTGADVTDKFAWGSITKMWTGASIMQLVAQGKLDLHQPVAPIIDAQLAAMAKIKFPGMESFNKMSDLWGAQVETVTLRDLLAMQSGIPDFDTANPSRTGPDLDPFRAKVYSEPGHDFLEPYLLSVPWVATGNLTSTPGEGFHYSSTNFGLLGLMLAHHAGEADYRKFKQSSFLPPQLAQRKDFGWASTGSPAQHGVLAGFDRTDYNGQNVAKNPAGVNVGKVSGVFAGYSAADFIGSPSAVAEIGYALWGKPSALVPAEYRDLMVPNLTSHDFRNSFYGLASQNVGLMGITGGTGEYSVNYGHLGATYGYDSIFGYNPTLDLGIAIATNIETSDQEQPADAYCHIYNRVKNFLLQQPVAKCEYKTNGYYGGKCVCT